MRSALHAHMWPGMVMKPKPGAKFPRALSSGDESDFSVEYELLDEERGRAQSPERIGTASEAVRRESGDGESGESQPGAGANERGAGNEGESRDGRSRAGGENGTEGEGPAKAEQSRRTGSDASTIEGPSQTEERSAKDASNGKEAARQESDGEPASGSRPNPSGQHPAETTDPVQSEAGTKGVDGNGPLRLDEVAAMREVEHEGDAEFAEMEQIMHQMASVRDRLSGLPDGARREEAARYAMRLMSMFGDEESDGEAA